MGTRAPLILGAVLTSMGAVFIGLALVITGLTITIAGLIDYARRP